MTAKRPSNSLEAITDHCFNSLTIRMFELTILLRLSSLKDLPIASLPKPSLPMRPIHPLSLLALLLDRAPSESVVPPEKTYISFHQKIVFY